MYITNLARVLINGGTIIQNGKYGYRVRDHTVNPVGKLGCNIGYIIISKYCTNENGFFVIDKEKVNKLNRRFIFKKELEKAIK